MKKIGLVGGLGPASTVDYYLGLIERCRAEYGADVYPEIGIDSVQQKYILRRFTRKRNKFVRCVRRILQW